MRYNICFSLIFANINTNPQRTDRTSYGLIGVALAISQQHIARVKSIWNFLFFVKIIFFTTFITLHQIFWYSEIVSLLKNWSLRIIYCSLLKEKITNTVLFMKDMKNYVNIYIYIYEYYCFYNLSNFSLLFINIVFNIYMQISDKFYRYVLYYTEIPMENGWSDKFNRDSIHWRSDTEETGEEGRDHARCTDPPNGIASLRRCVTRSTLPRHCMHKTWEHRNGLRYELELFMWFRNRTIVSRVSNGVWISFLCPSTIYENGALRDIYRKGLKIPIPF